MRPCPGPAIPGENLSARAAKTAVPSSRPEVAGNASPGMPRTRKRPMAWLFGLILFAGLAGGVLWWWIALQPSPIVGRVVLAGDETGPVEIRVFRRDDLAAPWRDRLAAADARAAELDALLADARGRHRVKWLAYDEAERVYAVGEEYNMPDVGELRADRDAKKTAADEVLAEVDNLQAERDGLPVLEELLQAVPDPLATLPADGDGRFTLPAPGEAETILLVIAPSEKDGRRELRGWLGIVELPADGSAPGAVELSESSRLDAEAIRRFADGDAPH